MRRLLLSFVVVFLVACASPSSGAAFQNLNPGQLNTMLASKDFVFVNVHIPYEGEIVGTDLFIPFDQIAQSEYLAQLPAEKDAKIVLYCRSGRMSEIAANSLIDLGYSNVSHLEGGMVEWENQGFELIGN